MSTSRQGGCRRGMASAVLVILLIGAVLVIAGCSIQIGVRTKINDNGSGTFGFRLAADKDIQNLLQQQGGGDVFGALRNNIPPDWTITEGTDPDSTRWVLGTISFKNKDDLKSILRSQNGSVSGLGQSTIDFQQETSLFRVLTRYTARFDVAAALTAIGQGAGQQVTGDILSSVIQFQNEVTLPGSIGENNADEVNGNTLIWRPSASGTAEMTAVSSALRWPIVIAFIVGGLFKIGLIVLLLILFVRRRRPAAAAGPEPQPSSSRCTRPTGSQSAAVAEMTAASVPTEGEAASDIPPADIPLPAENGEAGRGEDAEPGQEG